MTTTAPWRLANAAGRAVLVIDDGVYDLECHSAGRYGSDPMEALRHHDGLGALAAALVGTPADGPLVLAELGPPVPRPQKIFGVGLNYRDHAAEASMELPTEPLVFTKFPSCLSGPAADVVVHGDRTDWEAELVVVIGRRGRDIAVADAWDHVAGLTCGQDVSDRRLQLAVKPPQFSLGKSRDGFGPTGPVVASVGCFADPTDLRISCERNGEVVQEARTSEMIFPVAELIAYLSSICTLEVGDLVFTGTPDGVGMARGVFLGDGDVLRTTIEGIGTMVNVCRV